MSKPQLALLSEVVSILLIIIITVELFFGWLYSSHYFYNVPFLLRLNTPLVFLIGPCIYFLIYSHIHPSYKWRKVSFLHLIPFIGVILYFVPLYVSSQMDKIDYLDGMYEALTFDSMLIGGLRRVHQSGYLVASLWLIRKTHRLQLKRKLSRSIYIILSIFTLFILIDIYRYFFKFDLMSGVIDSLLLSMVAIYLVFLQLRNPQPIKPITVTDSSQLAEYANRIVEIITAEKVYLNPKMSLEELSGLCDLQKHSVSQTINQYMKTNFNELINKYRVEEAVHLLESHDTKNLTIKAIGEMAGFNTVSSFNANFKKIKGRTPKEFRA
ncbi:MAG: helix-turn-helix domain-containing protein [Bacteroidota bacterium]